MRLRTSVGVVELTVWHGTDPGSGRWGCPIRQQWGLTPHQQCSPALEDKLAFTVTATGTVAQAAAVAIVLYGAFCALCGGAYVLTRTVSEVFLFQGEHLTIFRTRTAGDDLTTFLEAMRQAKLGFFKKRLATRLRETTTEEVSRYLLYLRESGLISEPDYDALHAEFQSTTNARPKIGF